MSTRQVSFSRGTDISHSKVAKFHAHGCTTCGRRYMDSCPKRLENAVCSSCRTGRKPPLWDAARFPAECCKTPGGCRTAYTGDRERYALGGPGPWWICKTCARTHPFNPSGTGASP